MTTSDSAHSQTDKLVSGAEEDGGGEKQPDTYAYGVKLVGNDPRGASSWKAWLSGEAGTPIDGFLLTASSQIGQIMLTLPNAFAKSGLAYALPIAVGVAIISLWTMYLLISLYMERRAIMMKKGLWYNEAGERRIITQYHEVMGDLLGRWVGILVIVNIALALFGTCVAQVVASSADAYYITQTIDKRTWAIIWGAIMMLTPLLPSFRHFRVINIIGLAATTYTTWYIVGTSAAHGVDHNIIHWSPVSTKNFYLGMSVLLFTFGSHPLALEIMDSMLKPDRYDRIYLAAFLYVFTLTLPHSISVNLAFGNNVLHQGNVFGSVPQSHWRQISIVLMLMHQVAAFAYFSSPLYYIWEKFLHVHTAPYWVRIPLRYPVALAAYAFAVAFPFYGELCNCVPKNSDLEVLKVTP